jgi:hypothetical protein
MFRHASALVFASSLALPLTAADAPAAREILAADAARTTSSGATFTAPAGWAIEAKGPLVVLTPPEGDSHLALVDVEAKDADAAVAAASAPLTTRRCRRRCSVPWA